MSACSGLMYSGVPINWPCWVKIVCSVNCWLVALAIPKSITFGKVKEVSQFDEGVLFNGRRWFQDPKKGHITFHVTDYIKARIESVTLAKRKARNKR